MCKVGVKPPPPSKTTTVGWYVLGYHINYRVVQVGCGEFYTLTSQLHQVHCRQEELSIFFFTHTQEYFSDTFNQSVRLFYITEEAIGNRNFFSDILECCIILLFLLVSIGYHLKPDAIT